MRNVVSLMVSKPESQNKIVHSKNHHDQRGVASLELAMLGPTLMVVFLSLIQIIIYLQSATATQYAAFAAARAFQVYGDKKLGDISYPNVAGEPYTSSAQTIAEAAAEKVIFESLLWESKSVKVDGSHTSLKRLYTDGVGHGYGQGSLSSVDGNVSIRFLGCNSGSNCEGGEGIEVQYCMPIVFPGAKILFSTSSEKWPCKGSKLGRDFQGIAVTKKVLLPREPLTP